MDPAAHLPLSEFPILEHGHYANHAGISPWPRSVAQAVMDFAQENAATGPRHYDRWLKRERELKTALAELLNAASAADIALLKNTTEGICTVAGGIDWRAGDNVVLPVGEFPSNRLPWLALERRGVEIREVDIRTGEPPEAALLAHMDSRTRLLSVSSVQWTDGLRLRLDQLGRHCRDSGVLFFVDAIQQLGALRLDVESCHIDFLAADGHKWLLAPEGVAVLYCRGEAREQLQVSQHGWHMVDDPYRFDRTDWRPSHSASKFEAGSPNLLGQAALIAAVKLLREVGMKRVEACVEANSTALYQALDGLSGVEPVRALDTKRLSGIVSFKLPGRDPNAVLRVLKERGVTCAIRDGAIRLSPHFYQRGKPVQNLLDTVTDSI